MSSIDVEQILKEISPDAPCGENLEYDADYLALEREVQGSPEQVMGDSVIEAREPDWADVRKRAIALFERSKDLRIGLHLTRALLLTKGMPGLADGLMVLHRLIGDYWDSVYPLLDPDDDNDPTVRVNILTALSDPEAVLSDLRAVPLVVSRAFGPVTYRDVALAVGELKPVGDEQPPELTAIKAAFKDCDAEQLSAAAEAANAAMSRVGDIEVTLTEKVGVGNAADLSGLAKALKPIARFLAERLAERGLGPVVAEEDEAAVGAPAVASAAGGAARPVAIGEVGSREDVARLLDKICEYFERYEPSSPVPLLLRRAKRLLGKDFLEIMRDLVPDGVTQAEHFRGAESEETAA